MLSPIVSILLAKGWVARISILVHSHHIRRLAMVTGPPMAWWHSTLPGHLKDKLSKIRLVSDSIVCLIHTFNLKKLESNLNERLVNSEMLVRNALPKSSVLWYLCPDYHLC